MRYWLFIGICFLTLFFSCVRKEEIPADVIPRQKMIEILTDVQLAEAKIQSGGLERNDSTKAIAYGLYKYLFEKHNITEQQFKTSFEYYSSHLDIMSKMYDEVIVELNKIEAKESGQ